MDIVGKEVRDERWRERADILMPYLYLKWLYIITKNGQVKSEAMKKAEKYIEED